MSNKTIHDINNYLMGVLGSIEMAINKIPSALIYLVDAKNCLSKAMELTNTLFTDEKVSIDKKGIAILLADDEYYVLKILKEMLIDMGYEVETAGDGEEALRVFSKDPKRYALVVLDVTMPRKNGVNTFLAMKQIDPKVEVIMISGYLETILSQQLSGLELAGFLQKPIYMSDLYKKVEEVLNRKKEK